MSRALAPAFDQRHPPFEPVPDDVLARDFRDAGSDQRTAVPAELAAHLVPVGLTVAGADRNVFGPVALPFGAAIT